MATAGLLVSEITRNKSFSEKGILNLQVTNTGDTDLYVVIKGVRQLLPAFDPALKLPLGTFRIESYGNAFDLDFAVEFAEGTSKAVVSYLKLKDCRK